MAKPSNAATSGLASQAEVLGVQVGNAAALGMDLAPIEAVVQRLRAQVDQGRMPGFMSVVVKEGRLVHFHAHGLADAAAEVPMRPDAIFRLYSQTKGITVVGALKLLERGEIGLDEPVSRYVPSFAGVTVGEKRAAPQRAVLIRDLLGHTSGLGFGPGFGYDPDGNYEEAYMTVVRRVDNGEVATLAQWCDEISRLPLHFHPGKDWGYGYSSDILGRVVEVTSGMPLDEFLRIEVLEPLGMHDTAFALALDKADRLAALYKREPWDGCGKKDVKFVTADPGGSGVTSNEARRVIAQASDGDKAVAPSSSAFLQGRASTVIQGGGCVCSMAGGLVSTMRDYLRFGQMLLQGGQLDGVRLLKPASVGLLVKDWLNDVSVEKRRQPLWVWDTAGIGFSPLGQIGVAHPKASNRRGPGAQLHTVHWGGAGGSGYMLNWPHQLQVLTYTGCVYDTETQKALWRSSFTSLRQGKAKPVAPCCPGEGEDSPGDVADTPRGTKRPACRPSPGSGPSASQPSAAADEAPSAVKEVAAKRKRTSTGSVASAGKARAST